MRVLGLLLLAVELVCGSIDTSVILKPLLKNYDKQSRPYLDDGMPVVVEVQYRVNRLYNIDSVSNSYSMDTFFRLRWHDPRLAFNVVSLLPNLLSHNQTSFAHEVRVSADKIWTPDIIIYNGLSTKMVASSVSLWGDGTLFWSRQLLLNLTCSLDLLYFPYDVNELPVTAQSFSYGTPDLVLIPFNNSALLDPNPVPTFKSTIFTMLSTRWVTRNVSSKPAEEPVMQVEGLFKLKRQERPYMLKYVLPLGFLVFLSTLSYFIDPKSPPARVAAAVLLVLTTVSFNLSVGAELPKLDYVTLIDWFVIGCFTCSLSTVVEYSAVNFMVYHEDKRFHAIGFGIDDFFKSTVPILWLLVFLFSLFWLDQFAVRVALAVLVILWLAWLVLTISNLVRVALRKSV